MVTAVIWRDRWVSVCARTCKKDRSTVSSCPLKLVAFNCSKEHHVTARSVTLNLIQHHPAEGPGEVARWAEERGLSLQIFRADLGQLPPVSGAPVVLLGGPYESNGGPSWLEAERQ